MVLCAYGRGCREKCRSAFKRSRLYKEADQQTEVPARSGICLDGEKCRVTDSGKPGQLLEVNFREAHSPEQASAGEEAAREIVAAEPFEKERNKEFTDFPDLEILYEDEYLLAVNKPSGLACHKGRGHYTDHLGNQVVRYFLQKGRNITVRQIGRLDLDTSGIVLFALDPVTAQRLWKQRQERAAGKDLLCSCARQDGTGIMDRLLCL